MSRPRDIPEQRELKRRIRVAAEAAGAESLAWATAIELQRAHKAAEQAVTEYRFKVRPCCGGRDGDVTRCRDTCPRYDALP